MRRSSSDSKFLDAGSGLLDVVGRRLSVPEPNFTVAPVFSSGVDAGRPHLNQLPGSPVAPFFAGLASCSSTAPRAIETVSERIMGKTRLSGLLSTEDAVVEVVVVVVVIVDRVRLGGSPVATSGVVASSSLMLECKAIAFRSSAFGR